MQKLKLQCSSALSLLPLLLLLPYCCIDPVFSSNLTHFQLPRLFCRPDQSFALIQFKNSLSVIVVGNGEDKTESWKEGVDCCLWEGVSCHPSVPGYVIGLDLSCDQVSSVEEEPRCSHLQGTLHPNSSVFELRHLRSLNLAHNDFNGSTIPSAVAQLTSLTHLNLSKARFSGRIPPELSRLSKLVSLDISFNDGDQPVSLDGDDDFSNLVMNATWLSELQLGAVDMSNVKPSSFSNVSSSLRYLDLSYCGLAGDFPESVFRLPNLETLVLATNPELTVRFPLSNWSSSTATSISPLKVLDLSSTNFSGQFLPTSIGNFSKSLTTLSFSGCELTGSLPSSIGSLTFLTSLNLSSNSFSGPLPSSIWNLTSLTYMNLAFNLFEGSIPSSIENLTSLAFLVLSNNPFSGEVPNTLANVTNLEHLDLSFSNFSGSFSAMLGNFSRLLYLDVWANNFVGDIPSSIFHQLPKLTWFVCSYNRLSGSLPAKEGFGLGSIFKDLQHIDLGSNFLNGTIPPWLLALPSLNYVDVSDNELTGEIPAFQSNSLKEIYLDHNQLSGPIPKSLSKLVNATMIQLNSNKLDGVFLLEQSITRLQNLMTLSISDNNLVVLSEGIRDNSTSKHSHLSVLELSSCGITRISPFLLDSISYLWSLDLSHNFLTSMEFLPPRIEQLLFLDLSYNLIQGPLFIPWSSSLSTLEMANNKLTGKIPHGICNFTYLSVINLSNNTLTGEIPECLPNLTELSVLNLRMNNLHGLIPATFKKNCSLVYMDLNGNKLQGSLPRSLAGCENLEVLDAGNNKVNDVFPQWLSSLPRLKVLVLSSNNFHGAMKMSSSSSTTVDGHHNQSFPKLRILDLSNNYFKGLIPTILFDNLPAMMVLESNENAGVNHYIEPRGYRYSVALTVKGHEMTLERVLTIFTTVDLSNNYFRGTIPDTIGKLKALLHLNISHNRLSGPIPSILANLSELKSLDLSSNKLGGEIPWQLAGLSFLGVLNLSQNALHGPIPFVDHLRTFDNTSYVGNEGLCGAPLSKKCRGDDDDDEDDDDDDDDDDDEAEYSAGVFDLKFAGMGYGCGLVIGISTAYIVFTIKKPRWFVEMVEETWQQKAKTWSKKRQRKNEEKLMIETIRRRRNRVVS